MKKGIYVLTLFVLALGACKHHCPDETPPHYTFLSDDLHYFDFPVGAWWVYVNDSTGQRDSVYLTQKYDSLATYYDEAGECVTGTGDFKIMHYHSDCLSPSYYQSLSFGDNQSWALGYFYMGNFAAWSFFSPSISGQPQSKSGTVWRVGDLDSVNVHGMWFYDIHEYKCLVRWTGKSDYDTADFTFSRDIGLIKWSIENTDSSWRLLNYGGL